ncbi:MAG: MATE family efflux transporter [candidate division KSB1 bacterium]|nr:MATE family efflux transporter [candidate division KSB1 bacterium]
MKNSSLTEGSILKSLWALSVPIVFANLLQTAYQLTDTFWVGRLGGAAVAAVSVSFPIIFLLVSLGGGLTIAGTILVAQFKGRNHQTAMDHITAQTFLLVFVVSLLLSVLGILLSPLLLRLMGTEAAIFEQALVYLKISFAGLLFSFVFMAFQSLLRGIGDVKTPAIIVLGTVLLNVLIDPLFIFGWGPVPPMGVKGAAIATLITQAAAAVIGLHILIGGSYGIRLVPRDLVPDLPLIGKVFELGFPASIEHSARALGTMAITFLVAGFGTQALAAYGIGSRVLSFVIIPSIGLSMATSTLVGQNVGAGQIRRAERIAVLSAWAGFVPLTVIGVLFFVFAEGIAAVFIPREPETIRESAVMIRHLSISFGFIGAQMALNGAFRGSGNTLITMMLSILTLWVLQLPTAWVLSRYTAMGVNGLWASFPAANIVTAFVSISWFRTGRWKRRRLTEEIKVKETVLEEVLAEKGLS